MKKLLDFIIIFLLVFLIISIWNKPETKKLDIKNKTIVLKTLKNSYTVPAWIKLSVENKTESWITIDICNDLQIKYTTKDKIINLPKSFCDKNIISIKSDEKKQIDYSKFMNYLKKNETIL